MKMKMKNCESETESEQVHIVHIESVVYGKMVAAIDRCRVSQFVKYDLHVFPSFWEGIE